MRADFGVIDAPPDGGLMWHLAGSLIIGVALASGVQPATAADASAPEEAPRSIQQLIGMMCSEMWAARDAERVLQVQATMTEVAAAATAIGQRAVADADGMRGNYDAINARADVLQAEREFLLSSSPGRVRRGGLTSLLEQRDDQPQHSQRRAGGGNEIDQLQGCQLLQSRKSAVDIDVGAGGQEPQGRERDGQDKGEARAQLRASFARCAAPETFGAVPPAAEVLATEWLAARGAAITEQADLLVLVAGHALASVRAHALGALAAAPLTTSQLLRAAESGHADVGAAVAARLNALQGDELNESLAAMLDSPVERVRALAIARLREAPSLSATAAVAPALLSSPHRDVEAWALAQLEDSALGADQDPARLQELVMTRLRGGASLRAAVRARVERGAAISTSLLLRIARGPHRVDAEWAAALLVERALSGQSVPAIQLLDSEVGERPCN